MITRSDIKNYQKLKQKKYSDREGKLLIEGEKLILEALSAGWKFEHIFKHSASRLSDEFVLRINTEGLLPEDISHKDFLSLSDTITPQDVTGIAIKKKLEPGIPPLTGLSLLLDSVSDPGNVGTILRTADWFGGINIYFSGTTADIYNPKVIRASMGASFRTRHFRFTDEKSAVEYIRSQNGLIYCADMQGETLSDITLPEKNVVLVLGNEAHGPDAAFTGAADKTVSITGGGRAESLNVGIAAGILMYKLSGR